MQIIRLIFSILIAINAVNPHKTPAEGGDNFERDITSLYRRNLEHLKRNLNWNIEPCENFFQHVCKNDQKEKQRSGVLWLMEGVGEEEVEEEEDETEDEQLYPFLYNKENRMHFLEEKLEEFGTGVGEILRDLYNDCKLRNSYDVISGPKQPRWNRMLYEIDFLARKSFIYRQWPFLRFQWNRFSKRYDLNWIRLAAKFAAHGLPSFINIFFAEGTIYIEPSSNLNNCRSLTEIEKSLIPILGHQRNRQIASVIARELWEFCRSFSITESEDVIMESNATMLLEEIYFGEFFTTLNLTETEVEEARQIPIDLSRLQSIFFTLLNSDPRIVFNFVIWHAYMELEYEDCFLLTKEFDSFLYSEYWSWHVFAPHFSRDVALATYLFQTTRFQRQRKKILTSSDWDKFLFKKLLRKDFNIERLIRNYSNTYLNSQQLKEVYDEANLEEGHFYGNLLSLRRLKLRDSFYKPLPDKEDLNHPLYFLKEFLHFSILILKQPLFHYFATQGFDLWYESNLLYTSDGYYTALDCLEHQTLLHQNNDKDKNNDTNIYAMLSTEEIEKVYRFHIAFAEAYQDYRFWLTGESFPFAEDFVLEYYGVDSQRILFYAVAQLYCGRNDLLYSSIINRSFMNLQEFGNAFNCKEEEPMNPIVKCMAKSCGN